MARIVVIEDHAVSLQLLRYLLEKAGHEVRAASDGESGVALVRETRPDLVLCDIQLPRLDGFGVRQALSDLDVPVVAMTALAMVGDRERILATGFDGYISKPIEPRTFLATIASYLASAGEQPVPRPPT